MMEPIIKKQKITKTNLARFLGVSRQSLYYQPILPAKDMIVKRQTWENGYQEAFYSQFKIDLGWIDRFETLGELIEAVLLQIHYYNTNRIHTSLKMSPLNFREQFNLKSLLLTLPQGQRQLV